MGLVSINYLASCHWKAASIRTCRSYLGGHAVRAEGPGQQREPRQEACGGGSGAHGPAGLAPHHTTEQGRRPGQPHQLETHQLELHQLEAH